jgi:hypothetical protein
LFASLRLKLHAYLNRFKRRNGPTFRDQVAKVVMHTCSLQLERTETRQLAPTKGAYGPMLLSGGAITTIQYGVFDKNADKVDKSIRDEPWRAFAEVTMRLSIESEPQFEVKTDGQPVDARAAHKAPGLELISALANYFPLLPRPHAGPTIKPVIPESEGA